VRSPLPTLRGELSIQSLRHTLPLDYRSWVTVGAALAAAGYGG